MFLAKEGIVIQAWYPLGHGDKALQAEPMFTDLVEKYGKSTAQIILLIPRTTRSCRPRLYFY